MACCDGVKEVYPKSRTRGERIAYRGQPANSVKNGHKMVYSRFQKL